MRNVLIFIIYIFTSLLTFIKLPLTFFQQDEWVIFGNYLYWDKTGLSWFERLFTFQQYTHLVPLSNFLSYVEFKLFALSFPSYAFFSIFIQGLNSFLVYLFVSKLLGKKLLGLMASFIFLTMSIPHQAITWVATTMGTASTVTVVLISLIFFAKFIQIGKKKDMIISSVLLFSSFFFKETSVAVIFFFPFLWLLYVKQRSFKKFLLVSLPFIAMGISYVIIRILFLILLPSGTQAGLTQPNIAAYAYRLFTAPLKSLVQSFIPTDRIISISNEIIKLGYPHFVRGNEVDVYVSQTIGSDVITYFFAVLLLIACYILFSFYRNSKEISLSKIIPSSLLFIAFTSLPLILIPGTAGYYSLLDGRHLYVTGIFSSILLAALFYGLFSLTRKKTFLFIIVAACFLLFLGVNMRNIRSDLNVQRGIGYTRRSILDKITSSYPKLSQNTIFFVESDTPYYGFPYGENILPFQSGFGQTLLVWYNSKGENFPPCFFKDQFLYLLEGEGYRECEGRGFGYFRKMDSLVKRIKEENIVKYEIIAFSYNSSKNFLSDVTQQVKMSLK